MNLAHRAHRLKKFFSRLSKDHLLTAGAVLMLLSTALLAYGTIYTLDQSALQAELIKKQQVALIAAQNELALIRAQNDRLALEILGETSVLKKETLTLHEQLNSEQKLRLASEAARDKASLANVVKEWRPLIASVQCRFEKGIQRGSGTLMNDAGELYVITNKHVVINKNQAPYDCTIKFPGRTSQVVTITDGILKTDAGELDIATIKISKPNTTVSDLGAKNLGGKSPGFQVCRSAPALGEQILILGYPAIGASEDITATEGIVSGVDGNYYITSAKVERGNSGGAAINLRLGCYLGTPTFVQSGQIESLARILKATSIFD